MTRGESQLRSNYSRETATWFAQPTIGNTAQLRQNTDHFPVSINGITEGECCIRMGTAQRGLGSRSTSCCNLLSGTTGNQKRDYLIPLACPGEAPKANMAHCSPPRCED